MKWTIAMTEEELVRKTIIEKAIDKRITQKGGAEKLGMSERHFGDCYPVIDRKGTLGWCLGTVGSPAIAVLEKPKDKGF